METETCCSSPVSARFLQLLLARVGGFDRGRPESIAVAQHIHHRAKQRREPRTGEPGGTVHDWEGLLFRRDSNRLVPSHVPLALHPALLFPSLHLG